MTEDSTRLIHTRKSRLAPATVNPSVDRGSTVLFDTVDALYGNKPTYGRMGHTVHRELEAGLSALEHASHTQLTSNGLQACALSIASVAKAGEHILISDTLYGPTRRFCEKYLSRMGVEATTFAPRATDALTELIKNNTVAIVMESPGSLTMELHDTRAIVSLAKSKDLITILDNTWGAGLFHKPLEIGVDISVQALTKYVCGHADALGGAVMTNRDDLAADILMMAEYWGLSLSSDDAYLCLRGLRTLDARLKTHEANALEIANWLDQRADVASVLHPALPGHPDHAIWKRDFTGSCGLFSVILNTKNRKQGETFTEALRLFGMGFSWGGYESLAIPCDRQLRRTKADVIAPPKGALVRLHIGLEASSDLKTDLERGFTAMAETS